MMAGFGLKLLSEQDILLMRSADHVSAKNRGKETEMVEGGGGVLAERRKTQIRKG